MSLSPEREANEQAAIIHAARHMTPAELVQLQDDLTGWKDHAARLSADLNRIETAMIKLGMKGTT